MPPLQVHAEVKRRKNSKARAGKVVVRWGSMSANPFDIRTVLRAKHAQQVVLIHFPIALFIAAVGFDDLA